MYKRGELLLIKPLRSSTLRASVVCLPNNDNKQSLTPYPRPLLFDKSFRLYYIRYMATTFEWDLLKNEQNEKKHGVSFFDAQYAFVDPRRVIIEDLNHSEEENRFFCLGKVKGGGHDRTLH